MKYLLLCLLLLPSSRGIAATYPTSDTDCDGYPQVQVGTQTDTCLGLVTESSAVLNWRKPRRIVQIPDTQQFVVTDMGGMDAWPWQGVVARYLDPTPDSIGIARWP